MAKICAEWPDARDEMRRSIEEWQKKGYSFNLDWLLRSVNTVLIGEAKFQFIHNKSSEGVHRALHQHFAGAQYRLHSVLVIVCSFDTLFI